MSKSIVYDENVCLEQIKQTIREMFQQRGYSSIQEDKEGNIFAEKKDKKKVIAITNIIKQFNVKEFQAVIGILQKLEIYHGIIVYFEKITPQVLKTKDNFPNLKFGDNFQLELEMFPAIKLRYNITKHYLVPTHEKADPGEVNEKDIPKLASIKLKDAVSTFLGFKLGDLIRITRKNGFVTYRRVVR